MSVFWLSARPERNDGPPVNQDYGDTSELS